MLNKPESNDHKFLVLGIRSTYLYLMVRQPADSRLDTLFWFRLESSEVIATTPYVDAQKLRDMIAVILNILERFGV